MLGELLKKWNSLDVYIAGVVNVDRISDVKKDRIRNITVERNTSIEDTYAVEAVKPVKKVTNRLDYMGENSLLLSDEFYDRLASLKREYKHFYQNEQKLESAIRKLKEGKDHLTDNMANLVEKYNSALVSLNSFDTAYSTCHSERIKKTVMEFKGELENIGIYIREKGLLEIKKEELKHKLSDTEYVMQFLFEPVKGLITKLYRAFRSINVPEEKSSYFTEEILPKSCSGTIIDKRS